MIRKGTKVEWSWGNGTAEGTITETHSDPITIEIDGTEVTRNGSDEDPACVIEQEDGTRVLKLKSELSRAD
ncbi:MAG: DUF2945 domain-containing protein [Verrucomicrobiales bacterium]|nr:DUF2945 domain-containing protein [Verrucomicrobiales bacterium]